MGEEGTITLKRRRHTPEQVIRKLREADRMLGKGKTIPEVAKAWAALGFAEALKPGSVLAESEAPKMPAPRKYPDELRERAVRLVFESGRPIAHVAADLGVHKESLRHWVRQAEADAGARKDMLTTSEFKALNAPVGDALRSPSGLAPRDPDTTHTIMTTTLKTN